MSSLGLQVGFEVSPVPMERTKRRGWLLHRQISHNLGITGIDDDGWNHMQRNLDRVRSNTQGPVHERNLSEPVAAAHRRTGTCATSNASWSTPQAMALRHGAAHHDRLPDRGRAARRAGRDPAVNRSQLHHAIRAACAIADVDRVIVVGSQSILGSFDVDELPPVTTFVRR